MLIAFSGTDCSGKSTQIKNLCNSLKGKPLVRWSRVGYTPLFNVLKDLIIRRNKKSFSIHKSRDIVLKNTFFSTLWIYISILDLLLFYSIYIRLLNFLGFAIILDRYVLDSQIDLQVNFPQFKIEKSLLWRFIERLSPKPSFHFLLICSPQSTIMRSKLKNEPFPDSNNVIFYRYKIYHNFIGDNNLIFFNTSEYTAESISLHIQSHFSN